MATLPTPIGPSPMAPSMPAPTPVTASAPTVPKEIEDALIHLITQFREETRIEYRTVIEKVVKARAFWRGVQNGVYNEAHGVYVLLDSVLPSEDEDEDDDRPTFDYCINMYQATGLIIIAALVATGVPGTRFIPEDPRKPEDITTARSAISIRDYVHHTPGFNSIGNWVTTNLRMYTDGPVLRYVRFLRDQSRFGFDEVPDIQITPQELQPAGYNCPGCGNFTPGEKARVGLCPQCGHILSDKDKMEPLTVDAPTQVGTKKVPAGRVLVDVYGVLETRLPYWADTISQCPYGGIETEVHISSLRAAYPAKMDQIQPGYGTMDSTEQRARRARQESLSPAGVSARSFSEMVTWARWFIRPSAFYSIPQMDQIQPLLQMFPDGVVVELSNDVFLAARPERMDDHLALGHALPGDGMFKPAIGDSFVPVQEMTNEAYNINYEAMEYASFPPVFYNSSMLTSGAIGKRMRPAQMTPIKLKPDTDWSKVMWQPTMKEHSTTVDQIQQQAFTLSEFLTGAMPALFGGSEENIRTLGGYAMARDQALQRMGIPYQNAKQLEADTDLLVVKEFVRNNSGEVSYATPKSNSKSPLDYEARTIKLADAQGRIRAYPESSETFPVTGQQKRSALEKIAENQLLAPILTTPANMQATVQILSIPELTIPGVDLMNKILVDIQKLLEQQPVMVPGVDPMTGQPTQSMMPSMMPDDFLDDPMVVVQVVKDWAVGPAGMQARDDNPMGYQNVIAYGKLSQQKVMEAQAAALQAQAEAGAGVGEGKGGTEQKGPPGRGGARASRVGGAAASPAPGKAGPAPASKTMVGPVAGNAAGPPVAAVQ